MKAPQNSQEERLSMKKIYFKSYEVGMQIPFNLDSEIS
jgi:hypothetical protein